MLKVAKHSKKQQVNVTVENLLPYGAFVRLEDATTGYIRLREMSWEGDIDPRQLVQVGQQIKAVILNNVEQGKIELSHRLTLPDPWHKFIAKYREGSVVNGRVKEIRPHGLFAEILPGVSGFVPLIELARWPVQEPEELFWIDDKIEAIITQIIPAKRNIRLSIRRRMEQQTAVNTIMAQLNPDDEISLSEPLRGVIPEDTINNVPVDPAVAERIGSILIVEDGAVLRHSLVQWLRSRGYQVVGASDIATALKKIENRRFGVCFVDLDLPDGDGLAFIQQLRQMGHSSHAIVMSSAEWMAERAQEIEQAGVLTVLFKPLDLEKIDNLLTHLGNGNGNNHQWQHSLASEAQSTYDSFQSMADAIQNGRSLEERLKQGLEYAFEQTKADTGIIFYLNPSTHIISVIVKIGRAVLNEEALVSLTESPVKDVLQGGMPVFETAVSKTAHARFRKLLDYLPFESCIGLPLGNGSQNDYALFLFHKREEVFHRYHLRDAQAVAVLLSVALERQALEDRVEAISSILLSGQLSAGFGHEVNNKITAMEIQIRNLQFVCANLDKDSSQATWQETLGKAKEEQERLLETAVDLKDTVHLFQNLTKSEQKPNVDTNQVIRQTQTLLQPILGRDKTYLLFNLAPDLPLVPGSVMRLQQVFLNIMLNGVQHMTSFQTTKRQLHISTVLTNLDNARPLKVSITDMGSGIHKHLWETIFDLGFSTREDGTGLGLFIARSLAESMGGRIYVEQSCIPIGTTFVIELPILKEDKS